MKYRIAAYITAYEDFLAINQCLEGINNQSYSLTKILIIDNSEKQLIDQTHYSTWVRHYPENVGIGAGIKQAIAWASQQSYDFLWTFDQDSIPSTDCLEILLETYQSLNREDYQIGIIAPTPIDQVNQNIIQGAVFIKDTFIGYNPANKNMPYECDAPITSGSLISLAAAKMIEPPRSDLFIDGVDLDYGYRLKQQGFHNIIVPDAIMSHNFGNPEIINFSNKNIVYQKYMPRRHYYICRNHTYLELLFSKGAYKITCLVKRFKYLIYTIIKILIFEEKEKSPKVYACLLGTYHGLIGKLGKAKDL